MSLPTRSLGSLTLTAVGIGCNNFGRDLDLTATRAVVDAALDAGINFFDTADSYGTPKTASETFLGEALRPHRGRVVIATKFGRRLDDQRFGARPAYVRSATEASLTRLQVERIDLMQLHIPDPDTPITDTLAALADLRREGKIGEIGCSNVTPAELRAMNAAARDAGLPEFSAVQDELSMLCRDKGEALLDECRASGLSFLPFRPLFNGLLSGKYKPGAPVPAASRIGSKDPARQAAILTEANLARVASLTRYAQDHGHTILDLAFAWLVAQGPIPSVIAGVSSPAQVASNARAGTWTLTATQRDEVTALLDDTVHA